MVSFDLGLCLPVCCSMVVFAGFVWVWALRCLVVLILAGVFAGYMI